MSLQFRQVVAENTGDLKAMEKAAADKAIDVDDIYDERSKKGKKEKRLSHEGDDIELPKLRKRQKDSDDVIATLQTKLSESETEVTAYAIYIKATLQGMDRSKFKKARNRALEPFLESSSDEESQPGFSFDGDRTTFASHVACFVFGHHRLWRLFWCLVSMVIIKHQQFGE